MASRNGIGVVLLGIGAVACLAGALYWWLGPDRRWFYTDDGSVSSTLDGASPRDVMWRPPESLEGGVNSAFDEADPEVAPSGDAVYFTRLGPAGDADLYVAPRSGNGWGAARALTINTPDNELAPALSPDGAWLYFASDRPGSVGGFDLWRAPIEHGRVGEPEPLGTPINSPQDEVSPALAEGDDGPLLYYCSDRPDAEGASYGFDVFAATPGGEARRLSQLSSNGDDLAPAVSPAGDFLYFSSDREGGEGGFDLYRARLAADGPGDPLPLGSEINTPADELEPGLAMEGFALFFASDRQTTSDAGGGTDLYRAISREVYMAREARGTLGDLLALLPWILAALALVLLLALLTRVIRDVAWRGRLATLGLMARCVLLSMIAHGALMAILAAMHVPPTTMAGAAEDGSVRVSLASSGVRASVASQMRGSPAPVQITSAEVAAAEASMNAVEASALEAASVAPSESTPTQDRVGATRSANAPSPRAAHSRPSIELPTDSPDRRSQMSEAISTPRAAPAQRVAERASTAPPAARDTSAAPDLPSNATAEAARIERFEPDGSGARAVDDRIEPGAPAAASLASDPLPPTIDTPAELARSEGESPLDFVSAPRSGQGDAPVHETPLDIASAVGQLDGGGVPAALPLPESTASDAIGFSVDRSGSASATDVLDPGLDLAAGFESVEQSEPGSAPDVPDFEADALSALSMPGAASSDERAETERGIDIAAIDPSDLPGVVAPSTGTAAVSTSDAMVDLDPSASDRSAESDRFELPGMIADATLADAAETPSTELPDLDPLGGLAFAIPVTESRPRITGSVVDAETGAPIPNAVVRLDHEKQADVVVNATAEGDFVIEFGEIPENAALAAAHPGYSPGAVNIAQSEIERGEHVRIELTPVDPDIIAFETTPEVHHLGNDEYTGRINSQFQREAEGTWLAMPFTIPEDRLAEGVGSAELRLMTKGSQLENRVVLNGMQIGELAESPGDGSFGEQAVHVPVELLQPGGNVLELRSVKRRDTDIDDFEFVNVRLALDPGGSLAPLRIAGIVLDDRSDEPLAGATVRLDRIDGAPLEATSDESGAFVIRARDLPEFAALVAQRDGYEPLAVGISRDGIGDRLELRMTRATAREIALEQTPAVHHLGDDSFSGRVNSRFQRTSEGLQLPMSFDLRGAALRRTSRVELRLLAKGLETNPPVFVNGTPVARLEHSPEDGRFGEQRVAIPLEVLREGTNTIEFRSIRERADHDDYEFVNMRIVLVRGGRGAF